MEIGTVRQIDIDHEMQGAYLDYAMSVIISRALPDVRDGLKPVQRRILYAMHDMGLRPDTAYKKSAGIVGEVLGKYHPHSDDAVYEAMARLAQDFSMRYVLVDGQGNFGSIDGDSPAAMRYTEARLAPIAMELLADIEKETVDFVPNYDDSRTEPTVLPAALPNLLVSGASGIAVGMATNIPPHNLGEVCDALVYVIDHYDKAEEITVEDLTEFVQGPDFPTGGVVYRYAGEDGNGDRVDLIRNAYALGRGRLTVQARVHIEEMSRNRSRIVVTELPYQVNKSRLIERIAELVRDGRIEGITDLRDESDRQGMRISIELTRTVEPRGVLSQLFTLTPMQTTFSLRILALVNGEPRLLSLKRVLLHYLEHRQEIITRRSRYLLERAQLRAHVLEGLLKALDNIDEVIDIIRRSQTPDTARVNLMKRLGLTEIQAQAILDMPLKRLAALERRKIADEYKEKLQEIKYLQSLLRSPAKIRGVIREELMALREKFGDNRRTRIVAQEKGHHTARDLVEAADVLLTLTADGQVSRTSQAPGPNQSVPLAQARGDTRDDAVFFTASGQAVVVPLHQIPSEQPMPIGTLVGFDRTETVIGLLVVPHPAGDKEVPETFLTLATRGGRIKRIMLKDLVSAGGRGAVTVIAVEENDQLGWVIETAGQDELLLATRQGKAIRFSEVEVRPMGLPAAGVLAVKLGEQDAVVGGGVAQDNGYLVLFTEKGFAKRTAVKNFPTQKRYGGGVQATSLSARTGPVAAAAVAAEGQILVLIAAKRAALALPMEAIPHLARTSAGQSRRKDTNLPFLDLANDGQPVLLTALAAGGSTPAAPVHPSAEPRKPAPRSQKTAKVAAPEPAKGSGSTPKKTTGSKKVTQLELDQADSPSPKNTGKTSKSPKAGAKKPSPRRRGGSPSGENPKGRSAQDGSTEAAPQQEMVPTAKNRSQKQR